MTDIFLSYTERDRETARRVAEVLGSAGWSVWWDRRIPAGETWRSVLEHALEDMRCMVVLWSARSVESEWVCEEASEGRRQGKLVPVMIENVRPPAGFREIQAADLTGWDGSVEFDGLRMLLDDLENLLGKPAQAVAESPGTAVNQGRPHYDPSDLAIRQTKNDWWPRHRMAIIAVASALLLAAGGGVYFGRSSPASVQLPVATPEPQKEKLRPPAITLKKPPTVAAEEPAPVVERPKVKDVLGGKPLKSAETARPANNRCADLLARVQLGESLSYEAQAVFQKECQK
ncbi:MAG: toll/interleukin-1 receptor domain-containing protein [Dechloromonas sp.]|nr:toll/interleukin-1 receptor domain-containing protein [Dechloromonas sp.]